MKRFLPRGKKESSHQKSFFTLQIDFFIPIVYNPVWLNAFFMSICISLFTLFLLTYDIA